MIYEIKTFDGTRYEIKQDQMDKLGNILCQKKIERPDFIKILNGIIIATSTIAAITPSRQEPPEGGCKYIPEDQILERQQERDREALR